MNNLDKEIQRIVKQDIELPKEYKENIQKTLENCTQNSKYRKKKNRITSTLKKIGLTILVGATAITAYATGTKNFEFAKTGLSKIDENYQESAVDINQTIENEYLKITLDSMAADESYVITEFIIELKEKAINEIGTKEQEKTEIEFSDNILIDSKTARKEITNIEKISENKFAYTQVINKMNHNSEKNNLMMYINNIYIRLNEQEPWKGFAINKKIQLDIENKNDKNEFVEKEYILDENNKMIIKSITNSKFETYLLIQRITENLTYGEYKKETRHERNDFVIKNNNNEEIKYREYWSYKIYRHSSNDELEEVIYEYTINENENIKVEEDNIIYIRENTDCKSINITPVKTRADSITDLNSKNTRIIGDTIQIEIPEQSNAKAEFSNIKISDAKVTNIKCSYKTGITVDENGNQQDCIEVFTYKLYYDEDDNLLHIESGSENPILNISRNKY